ncbi:hypothetical protein ACJMK2_017983 [Sinanodonta woodiana]|uniref:Uncharacterized protein n=1 Tax=Sinanodonta woodiana TaxID=1069815 RepID=A0ABD3UFY4_SINWO
MKCKSKNPLTYYKDDINHRYKEYDNSEDDNIATLDSLNCSVGLDDDTDILQTDEYGEDIYIMEAETTGECCESLDPIVSNVLDVNTDHNSAPLQAMRPASNPGKFMTNEELLKVIKSTEIGEKSIPHGIKCDVYIVIEASDDDNGAKYFPDDCGVWDWKSAKTVNQTFVVTDTLDKLRTVYIKKEQYCVKKMVNGAIIYEPLFPQPSSVLTLHRYYTKLMEDNTFKKRITTIAGLPEFISVEKIMLAIVEYCGTMPTKLKKHGNSKKSEPYIKTDPKVIQRAAEMAEHEKVSNVMTKLMEDNSFTAPKSTRQINDKRFRNRKRKREENMNSRINIADDVVSVLSELHSNPVIQEIILTKHKKPVVIVYSNQQIYDMIRNCEGDDGSVLGVDRTFNLGNFYVTVFSYKNRCLISNRTKDFPVMFGPCMIHFDAEEETYGKFFSLVSDRLGQKTRLTIGSDEEKKHDERPQSQVSSCKFFVMYQTHS